MQTQTQTPKRTGREIRFADIVPFPGAEDNQMRVEGQAVVFDQTIKLFNWMGQDYFEVIESGALDEADLSDVVFRYNHHDSMFIMARTRGGSLQLGTDGMVRATFFNTSQARDLYELIKAGAIDKMSWAFTIREESFNKETRTWHVRKVDKVFDVAAVDHPAYDATSISARAVLELESERKAALERAAALESAARRRMQLLLRTYF